MLQNKVIVKVVSIGTKKLPCDFPWCNGVLISLFGDLDDLDNIQKELSEVKSLVNRDISKFKLNLKDFKILIDNHNY
tara:strand:- start:2532 stop:2762 length:231 start_codon:yes stop_codon:yes gene_type:complete